MFCISSSGPQKARQSGYEAQLARLDAEYIKRRSQILARIIRAMVDGHLYALSESVAADRWCSLTRQEWACFLPLTHARLRLAKLEDVTRFSADCRVMKPLANARRVALPGRDFRQWLSQQPRRGHVDSSLEDELFEVIARLHLGGHIGPQVPKAAVIETARQLLNAPVGRNAADRAWSRFRETEAGREYGRPGRKPKREINPPL